MINSEGSYFNVLTGFIPERNVLNIRLFSGLKTTI